MSTVDIAEVIDSQITVEDNFPSREGFGTPLVVGYHTTTALRVQTYSRLSEVAEDHAATHPVYLACAAIFAQNPRPRRVKVGRRAGAPTQSIRLTPIETTSGYVYSGTIDGVEWSVTVQPGDAVADICDDIVAAINALSPAVTAADGMTHVDVSADVAGTWFPFLFDVPRSALEIEDRTANPATTLQTDLDAILAEDSDWYGLALVDGQSAEQISAAAAWAESNGKLLIADSFDSDCADGGSTTDIAATLETAAYKQTALLYHRGGHGYFPSARWLGRMLPTTPGTETWALKNLAGLPADDLTASERTALEAKTANYYASIGGSGRILGAKKGGITAGGRFIDLTRCIAAMNADIKQDAFAVLANADKIPMTDRGMTLIGAAIRAVGERYTTREAIRDFVLTIPAVADIPQADRADRIASGFEWDAVYTGAAHEVQIRGRLSL